MVDDILVRLRMSGEEFSREVKDLFGEVPDAAQEAGEKSGEAFADGFKLKHAAIIGAVTGGVLLVNQAVRDSLDLAKDLSASAAQLGIGVVRLQEWRFAANQAGIGADELDDNVQKLTLRIGEANDGSRDAQKAFTDLGVGFKTLDGNARTTETTFLDVIERLSEIDDPTRRARLGTELLGEEYAKMEPLVRGGADGLRDANEALREMGGALSEEEIRDLQETNAKFEQMKDILSIRIADVVADNADAIIGLADAIGALTARSLEYAARYPEFAGLLGGAAAGGFVGGAPGAVIGAGVGYVGGKIAERHAEDANMDVAFRMAQTRDALDTLNRRREAESSGGSLFRIRRSGSDGGTLQSAIDELNRQNDLLKRALALQGQRDSMIEDLAAPPGVDPKPSRSRSRRPGKTDEEKAAEQALRAEEQFEEAVQRTLEAQRDSARVEEVRAELGEVAAAGEEARLTFLRAHPMAVHRTVEELAAALGITDKVLEADGKRLELQNDINAATAAEAGEVRAAERAAQQRLDAERARAEDRKVEQGHRELARQAERAQRDWENSIRDVADLYEDLFTGGTDRVWKNFKREGLRVVAEIAAQWTLSLISGQSHGNLGQIAGEALGRSPLGSIFGAVGLIGGAAANDNMVSKGMGGFAGPLKDWAASAGVTAGAGGMGDMGEIVVTAGKSAQGAQGLGGLSQIFGAGSGLGAAMGPMALAMAGGQLLNKLLGINDPTGGLLGPLGALAVNTVIPAKRGSAIIGGSSGGKLGVTGFYGNSTSMKGAAGDLGSGLTDSLYQIAEALGATVNSGAGRVSIGLREGNLFVDPQGRGYTKASKYKDIVGFGQDEEAAIRFALADLIKDGVLGGISDASRAVLQSGQDLEAAIEKAVLIESVPKLLRQRLDPLGVALEEIDAKFRKLAEALQEGGASAEQVTQARRLWQLEREDAVGQIGEASADLKAFLQSLTAGNESPLALRQQRAEADKALAPYVEAMDKARTARSEVERLKAGGASASEIAAAEQAARTAAQGMDQQGFQQAAQLVLGIARQMDASGGGFFETFDRIRNLTGGAIDAIDRSVPQQGAGADPFAELVAKNTGDTANMLADTNRLLKAINDNLGSSAPGNKLAWLTQQREFG